MPAPSSQPTVLLYNFAVYRRLRGVTVKTLETLTNIPRDRLLDIGAMSATPPAEAWFDEALTLSRVLCTDGITPLITDSLAAIDLGWDPRDDFDVWQRGVRLPLSVACRLSLRFGLADPDRLLLDPMHRQIWDILQSNERVPEARGRCPWCRTDASGVMGAAVAHGEDCLPYALWGARGAATDPTVGQMPQPRKRGQAARGSLPARGLKALRIRLGLTQRKMANQLGLDQNYFSRMERLQLPLTLENANLISGTYNIDRAAIYAPPPEFPPEIAEHVGEAREAWRDRNDPASPNYVDPDKPKEPPPGARWASDVSSWSEHLELVASGGSLPLDTAQGAAGENVQ